MSFTSGGGLAQRQWTRSSPRLQGRPKDDSPRDPRSHLDPINDPVLEFIEVCQEARDFVADDEIGKIDLRSRSFIAIQLQLDNYQWRRRQDGIAVSDFEALNLSPVRQLA